MAPLCSVPKKKALFQMRFFKVGSLHIYVECTKRLNVTPDCFQLVLSHRFFLWNLVHGSIDCELHLGFSREICHI